MTTQIIIIGLAFCFGAVCGGYLVYFLANDEETQQPFESFEDYMERTDGTTYKEPTFVNPDHYLKLPKVDLIDRRDIPELPDYSEKHWFETGGHIIAVERPTRHKSYHENQLERYNQIIKDRPKPEFEYVPQNRTKSDEANYYGRIQHMDEKEILDKFDIDIAKTCEEAENEIKKTEAFWLSKSDKTITIKRPSHETLTLDKNGNGGC